MDIRTHADLGQTLYLTRGASAQHRQGGYIIEVFEGKVEEIRISAGDGNGLHIEYVIWTGWDGDYLSIDSDRIQSALDRDTAVKAARDYWRKEAADPGRFRGTRVWKK